MSVSLFEISCDFPDCEITIAHGPAGPRLTAGAFQEAVDLLIVAHRWTVDKQGRDLCALHSASSDRVQKKGTVKYVPGLLGRFHALAAILWGAMGAGSQD
jgi:hypothetical protein